MPEFYNKVSPRPNKTYAGHPPDLEFFAHYMGGYDRIGMNQGSRTIIARSVFVKHDRSILNTPCLRAYFGSINCKEVTT